MSALSWRFGLWVMLCLLLLCSSSSVDDTCELCDLQQELESARLDLDDCRRRLGEKEGQKEGSSYLDRVCNWVTNPGREGKAVLKGTVDAFLRATRLDLAPLEDGGSNTKQVHLTVSLSQEELVRLRRFLLNDEGSVEEIQRILSSSYSLSPFSPTGTGGGRSLDLFSTFGSFLQHESFVVCQIAAVSLFVAVALWRKVKVWRVAVVVAVASVAWTWVHLYKVGFKKKLNMRSSLCNSFSTFCIRWPYPASRPPSERWATCPRAVWLRSRVGRRRCQGHSRRRWGCRRRRGGTRGRVDIGQKYVFV